MIPNSKLVPSWKQDPTANFKAEQAVLSSNLWLGRTGPILKFIIVTFTNFVIIIFIIVIIIVLIIIYSDPVGGNDYWTLKWRWRG